MRVKMNWCGQGTLTQATTGLMALDRVILNSLYDPDNSNTLGNHQPEFFDTFCAPLEAQYGLYHKYRVHGVRYHITFINSDTNTEHDVGVVIVPHSNAVAASDSFYAICQNKWSRTRSVGTQSANNKAIVKGYVDIKKLEGEKSLNDNNWSAISAASPSYDPSMYIFARAMSGNTGVGSVYCRVSLQYDVEFYDKLYRSTTD
jgi:hypothetical protein